VPNLDVDMISPLGDAENFRPELPQSLRQAFVDFVLGIAARAARTGRDFAASMLIHSHHRTFVQNRIGELVRSHLTGLRQQWRYDQPSILPVFQQRWESTFRPVIRSVDPARDLDFVKVRPHIDSLFRDPFQVFVLNSESDDVLDYDADPTLKAVLIGGNRLSRGLTLDGLLVSYFVRHTRYYDTLLQMGRWFGFREDYVDLTRLYTTSQLASWFRDLALAEEEIRQDIERYRREGLTPLEFGVKIRAHPAMLITA